MRALTNTLDTHSQYIYDSRQTQHRHRFLTFCLRQALIGHGLTGP